VHEQIALALRQSGFCVLSPYRVEGKPCFRVAISNHRTRQEDLGRLLEQVLEHGRRVTRGESEGPSRGA
jgi:hypothetical protein